MHRNKVAPKRLNKRSQSPTSEASLKRKCREYARKQGALVISLTTQGPRGYAGYPDDLYVLPKSQVLFVEFKMPGKKPTRLQAAKIKAIQLRGHHCYVVNDFEKFKIFYEAARITHSAFR